MTLFRPSRVENEYKTYKRLQTLHVKTLRNEGTRENLIRIITMRVTIQFVTQFAFFYPRRAANEDNPNLQRLQTLRVCARFPSLRTVTTGKTETRAWCKRQ